MNYKIVPTPEFIKEAKKLSKKHPKLPRDLQSLQDMLMENPRVGVHLGNNCYKVRLRNTSIKKGKSGGFRIITFFMDTDNVIRLLSIYPKSEKESIPDIEIQRILKKNNLI
jgi:mRNA-degrading endonuclease RelE of RelBE toxin-antitoxin system